MSANRRAFETKTHWWLRLLSGAAGGALPNGFFRLSKEMHALTFCERGRISVSPSVLIPACTLPQGIEQGMRHFFVRGDICEFCADDAVCPDAVYSLGFLPRKMMEMMDELLPPEAQPAPDGAAPSADYDPRA